MLFVSSQVHSRLLAHVALLFAISVLISNSQTSKQEGLIKTFLFGKSGKISTLLQVSLVVNSRD